MNVFLVNFVSFVSFVSFDGDYWLDVSPTITLVASAQSQSQTELLPGSSGSKVFNLRG